MLELRSGDLTAVLWFPQDEEKHVEVLFVPPHRHVPLLLGAKGIILSSSRNHVP